jgi:hypothetical protein
MSNDKKDKVMDFNELIENMPDEIREALGVEGLDKKLEEMRKRFEMQSAIFNIIEDQEPNEAVGALISVLTSVIAGGSNNLDEALAATSRIQSTIVKLLVSSEESGVAPWQEDEDEDSEDFPVEHKTKQ